MGWKPRICYPLRKSQSGADAHWVKYGQNLLKHLNPPSSLFAAHIHTHKFMYVKCVCKAKPLCIKQSKMCGFPKKTQKCNDDKDQRVVH